MQIQFTGTNENDGTWVETHRVTKSGTGFGYSVGIYGNYAIVGDNTERTVYWYQRKNDGTWVETHQVTKTGSNNFGQSVGIHGNYAIVGEIGFGVYFYQRKYDGSWEEIQLIKRIGGTFGDIFIFTETMRLSVILLQIQFTGTNGKTTELG